MKTENDYERKMREIVRDKIDLPYACKLKGCTMGNWNWAVLWDEIGV